MLTKLKEKGKVGKNCTSTGDLTLGEVFCPIFQVLFGSSKLGLYKASVCAYQHISTAAMGIANVLWLGEEP